MCRLTRRWSGSGPLRVPARSTAALGTPRLAYAVIEMTTISARGASLQVRPVTHANLDDVLDVYRRSEDFLALGPAATASLEMVLDDIDLAKREGAIFCGIYTADNSMVGVVEYTGSPFNGDPHCACLCLLMVARDYRNRGIGQAVLSAVETELRSDSQVSAIVAGVQVNNPRALAFWQRHGYRIVSGPEIQHDQTTVLGLRKDFPSQVTGGK